MKDLRLVIITGLSGAGKSNAIKCFEDLGFFCIDNLPPALLPKFAELCSQSGKEINKVALGIDIREREFFGEALSIVRELKDSGYKVEIVFLEASDEVLVRRFSETRRPHPLAKERPVIEGIRLEREQLKDLRRSADYIIDTSEYNVHEFKEVLHRYYAEERGRRLNISIVSFGFKYGIPYDADLVFDVRFLQNPNFVRELKALSGRDKRVKEYLFENKNTMVFIDRLYEFLEFLIPLFEREGKSYLTIGIGCTGGRHRSVVIAEEVKKVLKKMGYEITIRHRDIEEE